MSRKLQPKNKDLVNLEVKHSKDVWKKDKNNSFVLDSKYDYFGKIDKGLSTFITKTNRKGMNTTFVEDTNRLSKKTKNEVVKALTTKNTKVIYLVRKK